MTLPCRVCKVQGRDTVCKRGDRRGATSRSDSIQKGETDTRYQAEPTCAHILAKRESPTRYSPAQAGAGSNQGGTGCSPCPSARQTGREEQAELEHACQRAPRAPRSQGREFHFSWDSTKGPPLPVTTLNSGNPPTLGCHQLSTHQSSKEVGQEGPLFLAWGGRS